MRKKLTRATDTAARKSTVSTHAIVAASVAVAAIAFDAFFVYRHSLPNTGDPNTPQAIMFVIMAAIAAYAVYEAIRFQRLHTATRKGR